MALAYKQHEDHHAPAKYEFAYGVHDSHTGDIKEQKEHRDGDVVHGSYSFVDPDGYKRIVKYTADHHGEFNAIVHREPIGHHHAATKNHHHTAKAYYVAPANNRHHASPAHHHDAHSYTEVHAPSHYYHY